MADRHERTLLRRRVPDTGASAYRGLRATVSRMKIINVYQLFQNPTGDAGWQLWDGGDLVGVYQTRAAAREARLVYLAVLSSSDGDEALRRLVVRVA